MAHKLTTDEMISKIKIFNAETLLKGYNYLRDNWNPIDDERIEMFKLMEAEIIKRLDHYEAKRIEDDVMKQIEQCKEQHERR